VDNRSYLFSFITLIKIVFDRIEIGIHFVYRHVIPLVLCCRAGRLMLPVSRYGPKDDLLADPPDREVSSQTPLCQLHDGQVDDLQIVLILRQR